MLFKMVANQTVLQARTEKSVIKFFIAKTCKECKVCRRMSDGEIYFSKKMFVNGLICLKKVEIVFKTKIGPVSQQ